MQITNAAQRLGIVCQMSSSVPVYQYITSCSMCYQIVAPCRFCHAPIVFKKARQEMLERSSFSRSYSSSWNLFGSHRLHIVTLQIHDSMNKLIRNQLPTYVITIFTLPALKQTNQQLFGVCFIYYLNYLVSLFYLLCHQITSFFCL